MGTRDPQEITFRDAHGRKKLTPKVRLLNEVLGSWGNRWLPPRKTPREGRVERRTRSW